MLLPSNIDAEQAVLGAVLLNQHMEGAELLQPEHFHSNEHQIIYRSMQHLIDKGKPVDLVTLTSQLQDENELLNVGGVTYLAKLVGGVPTAANIGHYVGLVHEKHLHRETILMLQRQLRAAWSGSDPRALIADIQTDAFELSDKSVRSRDFKTAKEAAIEVMEAVEDRYANYGDEVTGVASGYRDLDKLTSGWQKSDLIIVAARPSVGKTAFALNLAQAAGIKGKEAVAVFSLEMSANQLVQRMLSSEGHIEAMKLRTGYMAGQDWENLTMAISTVADSRIFIDDSPALTVREIAAKCRRLHKSEGLGLIVIDYLQLIAGRGKNGENRQQEVSDISRTLKQLARELDVPVIALSQLSRGVEQRQDKRPMMSDLRESGSIEQDADIVAFLYRDDYYDKESEKKNIIEINLAKQRNGPIGTVELAFLKNFNKFVGLDRSHQPTPTNGKPIPDMHRGA
ncbi:replicative DNA helicase [Paenibacillus sp. 598K]|uniref:replicative DNA helicase n=1 Tax=Paenibacillus sp. 598K TaxID=1117987 RepID=UPI000FFE6822